MYRPFACAAAVLVLSSSSYAQRPAAASDARAGIAASWAEFITHWKMGHAPQSTAAFFTDDAINMEPGEANVSGRAAIEKSFASFHAANKISNVRQTTEEVQVSGTTAYERGTFVQTYVPANGQPATLNARYLAIWSRQADGKWKCTRFLFNDMPAK
jgi:uncharacterized protein (TIGR02246 family)